MFEDWKLTDLYSSHAVDISRVLEGSLWTFNKQPLLLERLKLGDDPRRVPVDYMETWVQVYDLKVRFMSDWVMKACAGFIGTFVSSCPKNLQVLGRSFFEFESEFRWKTR